MREAIGIEKQRSVPSSERLEENPVISTGIDLSKKLEEKFCYHNWKDHIKEVYEETVKSAGEYLKRNRGKLPLSLSREKFKELAGIAASFHDVGYNHEKKGMGHEVRSAQMAEESMKKAGNYSQEEISLVKEAIEDTTVSFSKEKGLFQGKPRNELSKILQDADLANLGSNFEECWASSQRVFKEVNGIDFDKAAPEKKLNFLKATQTLISNKEWNLSWVKEKREENRKRNAQKLEEMIEEIQQKIN